METESALYQLMGVRMNGVMNGITNSDGVYQEIIRKSDEYSGRLEELELPEEVRLLMTAMSVSGTCIALVLLIPAWDARLPAWVFRL